MAKKVLTPEEYQAKVAKKAAKRELFFGTFTKALALFLAIAIVWSLAAIAFTPTFGTNLSTNEGANSDTNNDDDVNFDDLLPPDNGGSGNGGSNNGGSSNGGSSNGGSSNGGSVDAVPGGSNNAGSSNGGSSNGGSTSAGVSKADAIKAINNATSKAYKGNYTWERKCYYTSPIDVGSATGTLNSIIQGVDENANLDTVVGGFLGITGKESDPAWTADVKGGKLPEGTKMNNEKYLMKAFALTEGDVKQYRVSGNQYLLQLNSCSSPQKDGKNALHHVTNDFITLKEVQDGVTGAVGSAVKVESCDVEFTKILVLAVIDNGNLQSVQISYSMNVKALNLKAAVVPITGKGAGDMVCTYKNFS